MSWKAWKKGIARLLIVCLLLMDSTPVLAQTTDTAVVPEVTEGTAQQTEEIPEETEVEVTEPEETVPETVVPEETASETIVAEEPLVLKEARMGLGDGSSQENAIDPTLGVRSETIPGGEPGVSYDTAFEGGLWFKIDIVETGFYSFDLGAEEWPQKMWCLWLGEDDDYWQKNAGNKFQIIGGTTVYLYVRNYVPYDILVKKQAAPTNISLINALETPVYYTADAIFDFIMEGFLVEYADGTSETLDRNTNNIVSTIEDEDGTVIGTGWENYIDIPGNYFFVYRHVASSEEDAVEARVPFTVISEEGMPELSIETPLVNVPIVPQAESKIWVKLSFPEAGRYKVSFDKDFEHSVDAFLFDTPGPWGERFLGICEDSFEFNINEQEATGMYMRINTGICINAPAHMNLTLEKVSEVTEMTASSRLKKAVLNSNNFVVLDSVLRQTEVSFTYADGTTAKRNLWWSDPLFTAARLYSADGTDVTDQRPNIVGDYYYEIVLDNGLSCRVPFSIVALEQADELNLGEELAFTYNECRKLVVTEASAYKFETSQDGVNLAIENADNKTEYMTLSSAEPKNITLQPGTYGIRVEIDTYADHVEGFVPLTVTVADVFGSAKEIPLGEDFSVQKNEYLKLTVDSPSVYNIALAGEIKNVNFSIYAEQEKEGSYYLTSWETSYSKMLQPGTYYLYIDSIYDTETGEDFDETLIRVTDIFGCTEEISLGQDVTVAENSCKKISITESGYYALQNVDSTALTLKVFAEDGSMYKTDTSIYSKGIMYLEPGTYFLSFHLVVNYPSSDMAESAQIQLNRVTSNIKCLTAAYWMNGMNDILIPYGCWGFDGYPVPNKTDIPALYQPLAPNTEIKPGDAENEEMLIVKSLKVFFDGEISGSGFEVNKQAYDSKVNGTEEPGYNFTGITQTIKKIDGTNAVTDENGNLPIGAYKMIYATPSGESVEVPFYIVGTPISVTLKSAPEAIIQRVGDGITDEKRFEHDCVFTVTYDDGSKIDITAGYNAPCLSSVWDEAGNELFEEEYNYLPVGNYKVYLDDWFGRSLSCEIPFKVITYQEASKPMELEKVVTLSNLDYYRVDVPEDGKYKVENLLNCRLNFNLYLEQTYVGDGMDKYGSIVLDLKAGTYYLYPYAYDEERDWDTVDIRMSKVTDEPDVTPNVSSIEITGWTEEDLVAERLGGTYCVNQAVWNTNVHVTYSNGQEDTGCLSIVYEPGDYSKSSLKVSGLRYDNILSAKIVNKAGTTIFPNQFDKMQPGEYALEIAAENDVSAKVPFKVLSFEEGVKDYIPGETISVKHGQWYRFTAGEEALYEIYSDIYIVDVIWDHTYSCLSVRKNNDVEFVQFHPETCYLKFYFDGEFRMEKADVSEVTSAYCEYPSSFQMDYGSWGYHYNKGTLSGSYAEKPRTANREIKPGDPENEELLLVANMNLGYTDSEGNAFNYVFTYGNAKYCKEMLLEDTNGDLAKGFGIHQVIQAVDDENNLSNPRTDASGYLPIGNYVLQYRNDKDEIIGQTHFSVVDRKLIKPTELVVPPTMKILTTQWQCPLVCSFIPENANFQTALTYSSDNTKVAWVDEAGNIHPVAPGTANITVKSLSGLTKKCKITVVKSYYVYYQDGYILNQSIFEAGKRYPLTCGVTLPEKTGYILNGWNTKPDGSGKHYNDGASVMDLTTVQNGVVDLYAEWKPITYTVKFEGSNGSKGTMKSITLTYDKEAKLPVCTFMLPGYQCSGWINAVSDGVIEYAPEETVLNLTDKQGDVITLYADWEPGHYAINYKFISATDPTGAAVVAPKSGEYVYNTAEAYSDFIPTENYDITGYDFAWYTDSACTKKATEIAAGTYGDVTLYGKWKPTTYTVKFDANDKDLYTQATAVMADQKFTFGQSAALSANKFKINGYTFLHWEDDYGNTYDDKQKVANLTDEGDAVITLHAEWGLTPYPIEYKNVKDGELPYDAPDVYFIDWEEELKDAFRPGYDFEGWYTASNCSASSKIEKIPSGRTGKLTLYAKFTGQKYTVFFDDGVAESALVGAKNEMTPAEYIYGKATALAANQFTRPGYKFKGWSETEGGEVRYADRAKISGILNADGKDANDIKLYAVWEPIPYKITYTDAVNGKNDVRNQNLLTYTMDDVEATHGVLALMPPERPGYEFMGWYKAKDCNESSRIEYLNFNPDAPGAEPDFKQGNITVYAGWKPYEITVKFDANEEDLMLGTSGKMDDVVLKTGTSKNLPVCAFSAQYYAFGGWYVQGEMYPEDGEIFENKQKVDGNLMEELAYFAQNDIVTLSAHWTGVPYKITYKNVEAQFNVDNSMNPATYSVMSLESKLKDPVRPGYTFSGWYDNKNFNGEAVTELKLDAPKNITLYAKWTPNPATLIFDAGIPDNAPADLMVEGEMPEFEVIFGTTKNLPANTFKLPGYTFAGWMSEDYVSYKNKAAIDNHIAELAEQREDISGDRNVSLTALWSVDTYKITYKNAEVTKKDITNENPATYTIADGDVNYELKLLAPERIGYTFDGWYTKSNFAEETKITSINVKELKNVTIYAKWSPKESILVFNANVPKDLPEGTELKGTPLADFHVIYGKTKNLPAMKQTIKGYAFKGWKIGSYTYKDKDAIDEKLAYDVNIEPMKIAAYAVWEPVEYRITYKNADAKMGVDNTENTENYPAYTVEDTGKIVFDEVTRIGYDFGGWYTTSNFKSGKVDAEHPLDVSAAKNLTVYAQWIPRKGLVKFDSDLPLNAPEGSTLKGSVPKNFAITFGKNKTLPAMSQSIVGYTFVGWATKPNGEVVYKNKGAVDGYLVQNNDDKANPVTLYAVWAPIEYKITYKNAEEKDGADNTMNPASYNVEYANVAPEGMAGENDLALATPAKPGYTFKGWYKDAKFKTPFEGYATSGKKALTVYAKWEANSYKIIFDMNDGTSAQKVQSAVYDKDVTLIGNTWTREGYTFMGWSTRPDGSEYDEDAILNGATIRNLAEDGSVTLYAIWHDNNEPVG